ncbi:MAG: hypothetical protein ACRBBN_17360 [Methyloligellaceae bacterium]
MPNNKVGCFLACVTWAICLVFMTFVTQARSPEPDSQTPAENLNILPEHIGGVPFGNFLQSNSYLRILKNNALKHERIYGVCSTPVFRGRIETGRPLAPRSLPVYGTVPQWIEVVEIGGCKTTHKLHVLIAIVNDAPHFYPLLPGDGLSLLDFTITNDVMSTLIEFETTHALTAGCKKSDTIRIHKVRLIDYQKSEENFTWNETWEIANCKSTKTLKVNFTANPTTGTRFTIHQPEPVKNLAKKRDTLSAQPVDIK